MAQHRQAPSQFKEEPGHDSVSATLFFPHPASPGRKHVGRGNATDRTRLDTIPTPFPWQIFHIITHASREFRDPVRRQAHRISTRGVPVAARDRDCLGANVIVDAGRRTPSHHGHLFSIFPWTVCRVAASRARGSKSTTLDSGVPEDRHACRKNDQVRIRAVGSVGITGG